MIPFARVVCIDFEYRSDPGERPHVWCLVASDPARGTLGRWWRDELLAMAQPPFDIGRDTVVCSYAISAEMSCFLQLGWQPPEYLLDLYAEYRWATNGRKLMFSGLQKKELEKHKNGMLAAAFILGVPTMSTTRKEAMRQLAITRWSFTSDEQHEMCNYCEDDVKITEQILSRLAPFIDWPRALLRARYGLAVARMEHVGVPIDTALWQHVIGHWPRLVHHLIVHTDRAYGVFRDDSFSDQLLLEYLTRRGIPWSLTPTGRPMRDKDTLKEMANIHPELNDLKELLGTLGKGRLLDLAIGQDGYNRTGLVPFATVTARNAPSPAKFIFGPAVWLRGFIQAKPGDALIYVDWAAQEIAIVAALSGDENLMTDYRSGDPYIAFAIRSDLAPEGATKKSHPEIRELCKGLFLSLNYGRTAFGLARALNISLMDAETLIRRHERAYPQLYRWLQGVVDTASLTRWQHSAMGWHRYISEGFNTRSARNWPVQCLGAELMQATACALTEAGFRVAAPVHDAFVMLLKRQLVVEQLPKLIDCMEMISEVLTGGLRIRADAEVYLSPRRYMDRRGRGMWRKVMSLCRPQPTLRLLGGGYISYKKEEKDTLRDTLTLGYHNQGILQQTAGVGVVP